MGERVYKAMKAAGVWNIVLGILLIVFGIAFGVMNLVAGGKLLRTKKEVLF